MPRSHHQDIRIGTMVSFAQSVSHTSQLLKHGFECFELNCWRFLGETHLESLAKELNGIPVSSLGCYGNPLVDEQTRQDIELCIRSAQSFGAHVVCGFAGAVDGMSVEECLPRFAEVWGPLAKIAEDHGVKIAFENCDMGGSWEAPKWNIAHSPRAWEMMFNTVNSEALGLEWEPCHQMVSFIDPLPQLRKWVSRVHHIHGKDATVHKDLVSEYGIRSGMYVVHHRTPGFGDTNWTDLISILRMNGWTGAIDIEGWHDPVYRDELELTGQVHALNYLKNCRGGAFVPNIA